MTRTSPLGRKLALAAAATLIAGVAGAAATWPASAATTPAAAPAASAHVANPYSGAKGYVNPDWKKQADAESGGSKISNNPTGIWLDRIAAIKGTSGQRGLQDFLDDAVATSAGYIQFVIYDLPGRDCAALASNGELGPTDIDRYKTEYIDPIAQIMANSKYANLRIINIIEIDSLPNLVTNVGSKPQATAACDTMKANGNYVTGIQYALGKLHAAGSNIYNYVDAGHHGWLGWTENFDGTAQLIASTVKGAEGGAASIDGLIANTANYSALKEPFISATGTVGGQQQKQSKWIDWNQYVDEGTFAPAFLQKVQSSLGASGLGVLIDTSRNGWGGSKRPTKASTSTSLDTFVDESRIDRRPHAGDWCNQSGAGIGERPTAAPASNVDAYVWIKPPGESDGASSAIANSEGKGFDQMCDPSYGGNARNGNSKTGALPNAPVSGHWFSAQFQELLKNAYPAL